MPAAITMVATTDSGYFSSDKVTKNPSPAFEVDLAPGSQVGATIEFQIRDTSTTTSVQRVRLSRELTQADIDAGKLLFEVPVDTVLPNRTLYVAARTIDYVGDSPNLGALVNVVMAREHEIDADVGEIPLIVRSRTVTVARGERRVVHNHNFDVRW